MEVEDKGRIFVEDDTGRVRMRLIEQRMVE